MAGEGASFGEGRGGTTKYEGGVTNFVVLTCLLAATGGLLFGYDHGISGEVTSMESFLNKFFPSVFHKMKNESGEHNSTANLTAISSHCSPLAFT
ncbi:hypothetical protein ACFX1Q_000194 [Malus domestica]